MIDLERVRLHTRLDRVRRWFRWDRDGDVIRDVARAVVALRVENALASGRRARRPSVLPNRMVGEAISVLVAAKEANLIDVTTTAHRLRDTTGRSDVIVNRIEEAQNPPRMSR